MPYICTYPGHWRRMHGALYVVEDLDEYLAEPEAYVAKAKIEPVDELLKFNRPRTEWKLADLAPAVEELDKGGRTFARGKQIFNVAACVSCHKFDNAGQDFGPDLTKLDAKEFKTPADVLKHVLEPSLRIEEKYRSYKFDLLAGGSLTGMVLEKTPGGRLQGHREPARQGGKQARQEGRPRRPAQALAGVDHAEGPARQADEGRDPRPVGVRLGQGRREAQVLPGRP